MRTALVLMAAGAVACTDVQQNFPTGGCVADTLRCLNDTTLEKCRGDGSGYDLLKSCASDSPCGGDPPDCKPFVEQVPECTDDAACQAKLGALGDCLEAYCDTDVCRVHAVIDGTACEDGTACSEGDTCKAGKCEGSLVKCDDGNPCTKDSCDPATGCSAPPDDTALCTDKDPCTKNDACKAGACAGLKVNCDDNNTCTDDLCDVATGECAHTALSGACDDGDDCTKDDSCVAGVCEGDPNCPCVVTSDCAKFDPGNPCKGSYVCNDTLCKLDANSAFKCDTSGLGECELAQCTVENGTPSCKIVNIENGKACDDGSDCTDSDLCDEGTCVGKIDLAKSGCGFFKLSWWAVTPSTSSGSPEGFKLFGGIGYPQIIGTSKNDQYRVRAIGPGL